MNRIQLKTLAAIIATLLALPSGAATYQFRQFAQGLSTPNVVPVPAPSAVGDGSSTAGACATGAASGCATWNPTGLSAAITVSGNPALNVYTTDCHSGINCDAQATKSLSSGKWYWEIRLTSLTIGYGGLPIGIAPLGVRLNTSQSVYYYTYNGGQFYVGNTKIAQTNAGLVQGDVYGWALDMDAKMVSVTRNGKPLVTAALPVGVTSMTPTVGDDWNLANGITANFGQNNFAYPVPAGYNAGVW